MTKLKTHLMLKPKDGLIVKDPDTGRPIKKDGELVPNNRYYRRRLRFGDCVEVAAGSAATKSTKKGGGA